MKTMRTFVATLVAVTIAAPIFAADSDKQDDDSNFVVTPALRLTTVDGDKEKFREDTWMTHRPSGGVEDFFLRRKLGENKMLFIEGRALIEDNDFHVAAILKQEKFGFVRAGFTQFRKHFDGTGGYFPLITASPFVELNRKMHLDMGNIYFDVGLTIPDRPQIIIGYERQYKKGDKSMIEWGSVAQVLTPPAGSFPTGNTTRKIYPAYKTIDETVDIFKADLEFTAQNVQFSNQFRYESYDNTTFRLDDAARSYNAAGVLTTQKDVTAKETFNHDLFSNVFQMESHASEKIFWSFGYLFTTMDGGAGFDMDTILTLGAFAGTDKFWKSAVRMDQDSHVLNVNVLYDPWKWLALYAGIQAEKTETNTFADSDQREIAEPTLMAKFISRNDKDSFEENIGARFTKIPYTTIYAEAKWAQQNIGLFEEALEQETPADPFSLEPGGAFLRYTDTDVRRQQYTIGFNTAPLSRVTVSGKFTHSDRLNIYDHLIDEKENAAMLVIPVNGYTAFITRQQFVTDDLSLKVSTRLTSRVRATVKYQVIATDITTHHNDAVPTASPTITAGSLKSADYNSDVFSVVLNVTPIPRAYVTGQFSYQRTRTTAFDNGANTVLTYKGDVYSAFVTGGYALDDKTDLLVTYNVSWADNFEDNRSGSAPSINTDFGYPYGVDYTRHGLNCALTRRIHKNAVAKIGYGFYHLRERSNGGINDYSAHLAFGGCTIRF